MSDIDGPPTASQMRSVLLAFVSDGAIDRAYKLVGQLYEHYEYRTDHELYDATTAYEMFYIQGFMHCLGHVRSAEDLKLARAEHKRIDDALSEVFARKPRRTRL